MRLPGKKGRRLWPLALCLCLSLVRPAMAQEAPPSQDSEEIDASKLGVSIARIQKGLRIAESTEQRTSSPLRLSFQVQVYGQAPRIDVLKDYDLFNGPVPGTPPTHREVIEFLTPQIFRAPVMPLSALMGWAVQQLANHSKKANCEAEIASYRSLLMQGVDVSAPRCTQ